MSCLRRNALCLSWTLLAVLGAPRASAEETKPEEPPEEVKPEGAKPKEGSVDERPSGSEEVSRISVSGETEPEVRERAPRIVVGPLVAAVWRPSKSDVVSYGPGIALGAFAMIPLTSWLLARASFRQEFLSVQAPPGAIGIEGSPRPLDLSQPGLSALAFSAELEGVYRPTRRLALRGGLGIAWARIVAPPPKAANFYLDTERALAVSTVSLSLGAAYSLIPTWLELGVRVSGGLPFGQNGTFLVPLQAIVDGQIAHIDPLPETQGLLDATLELGLVF